MKFSQTTNNNSKDSNNDNNDAFLYELFLRIGTFNPVTKTGTKNGNTSRFGRMVEAD